MLTEILLYQAFASAVLSAIVAYNKNRHVTGWCLLGALFGVLGLIAVASVDKLRERKIQEKEPGENQEGQEPAAGGPATGRQKGTA